MSLKSRFFKKPWQHGNDEKRLAAVLDQHDPELTSALPELAEHDLSEAVRLAALRRINTEAFWLDARLRETDTEIREAADRFLLRAAINEPSHELQEARLQWFERIESTDTIRSLALKAKDSTLRQRALERVQAQGFLGDCYLAEPDADIAAKVLERIDQTSTLERLHQRLKKSSKIKTKAVLARIQAVQSSRGQYDAEEVNAERLIAQAEALARGEDLDQREARLAELRKAWSELEHLPKKLQARFRGTVSIIEAAMVRPSPAVDEPGSELPSNDRETASVESNMQHIAEAIREELHQNRRNVKPQKLLADWDRAWNALDQIRPADEAVKADFLPILKELQDQVQRQIQSASTRTASPGRGASSERGLDGSVLNAELDNLSQFLETGALTQANQHLSRIRAQLHSLPVKQRPKEISGRLQRLEGRLKEMRDYQHWSHNQQRDELIERVEALADSGQHPDAIAAALKEARAAWQELEKLELLPGEKRKHAAPGGQWRRFQEACSTAFDTAKPYFEKRQTVQEDTLARLEAFVESGLALVDDDSAGPKALTPVMRKARQAIRRLDDLPPRSRGAAAARLRDLMNAISKRLDSVFEQVEAKKRRLISEAETLSQEEELKTAIDRAKGLQADWKRAGQGRRKIDQALWKEFRGAIDPLFEQLDGQRKAREEASQAVIEEIKRVCEKSEALTELPAEELLESGGQMQTLVEEMSQLTPCPPALRNRFEQARHNFSDRKANVLKAQQEQFSRSLVECILSIQDAFSARLAGASVDPKGIIKNSERLPEGLENAIEAVSDETRDPDQLKSLAEDNIESALQIAVEFEFLSGLDSPAQEKNRRMDYQVKRLAARMSEGTSQQDLGAELAELEDRWYRSLPLPENDFKSILARIEKCQTVIRQMMGIA